MPVHFAGLARAGKFSKEWPKLSSVLILWQMDQTILAKYFDGTTIVIEFGEAPFMFPFVFCLKCGNSYSCAFKPQRLWFGHERSIGSIKQI